MRTMHDLGPYGPYTPSPGPTRRLGSGGGRRRNQLVGGLALVTAALVMMTLGPGLGLLVLGLLWVLVRALAAHLDDGGRRQWFKVLVQYAAVAALVVAVMGVAPAPDPPKKAPPRRPAATADQADPWGELRARWDRLVDRVSAEAPVIQFPADPKEGR
jgi:hypothetical protein